MIPLEYQKERENVVTDLIGEAFVHARLKHGAEKHAILEEVVECLSDTLRELVSDNPTAHRYVRRRLGRLREDRKARPLQLSED